MYLIIWEVYGYIEESNGNKHVTFASIDENKKVLKKHMELWNKIKYLIKLINSSKEGEYGKDFMKMKLNLDDNLPLNKILKIHNMTIVIRSVFQEDVKYYLQVFLDEYLYEL